MTQAKQAKKAFTIRLEEEIKEDIKVISKKFRLNQATVARSYLRLSKFFVAQPNSNLEFFDGTPFSLIPKEIFGSLMHSVPEEKLVEIGNELGTLFNITCLNRGIKSIPEKMEFLSGLGWLEIMKLNKKNKNSEEVLSYYGIDSRNWPITAINALLYRIFVNSQYPIDFPDKTLVKYLKKNEKIAKYRKWGKDSKRHPILHKHPNLIPNMIEKLGPQIENFDEKQSYYLFNQLIENQLVK